MLILTIIATPSPSFDLPDEVCENNASTLSVFTNYVNNGDLANGEFFINGTGQGVGTDIFVNDIIGLGVGIQEITYVETVNGTSGTCESSQTEVIEILANADATFPVIPAQCTSNAVVILGPATDPNDYFTGTGVSIVGSDYVFDPSVGVGE